MKSRFFLLGTNKSSYSKRFVSEIKYLFRDCINDDGDVQTFDDITKATTSIAKAVTDTHTIVFIASEDKFCETKKMLSKAFGFELNCDSELLEKACDAFGKDPSEEDYEFSVKHAFIPPQSRYFTLDDGAYTGFSVANGNQTIILLPFIKDRTMFLLTSQVIPYLNATYHISINPGKLKDYNTERLSEVLRDGEIKLAVAGTNTASFFKEYIESCEKLGDAVSISPITEKRGNMQPVDYVVNLSVAASELLGCRYGIAMSNAFYTGDSPDSEKVVYLAVTNERETAVRELHSFKGEDIPAFLARCSGDFCVFIADIIANDGDYEDDRSTREKAAVKRYKIAIIAVSAIIAVCALFSGIYFAVHHYSPSDWISGVTEMIFPAGNPFAELFDFGNGENLGAEAVFQD